MENLVEYLNEGVETIVRQALRTALHNPRETAFILRYTAAARQAAKQRLRAEEEGIHIPPFLIASISSQCNLYCTGCYARANNSIGETACSSQLGDRDWARIFGEAAELGISFILLAGGEPLLRRGVIEAAAEFRDVVFPVFTNGTLFNEDYIQLFDKNRNLVPLLSLEGSRAQTAARRGDGVYDRVTDAMRALSAKGILFGASITVTKENLLDVTDPAYVRSLSDLGCKVIVYVEYVPVAEAGGSAADAKGSAAPDAKASSAPDAYDRTVLLARQDRLREQFDTMLFVAFPGDEEALGGCLAAGRGFFHINPSGGAEPCPFSPFSDTSLKNCSLKDALASPLFERLKLGGFMSGEHLGGCTLFQREEEIRELVRQNTTI
jgi:MoaA/NifB/PqqE/SkfB family radical SAM enzyme